MSEKPTYEELEQRILELERFESDRERTERNLKESEQRYQSLINTMNEGLVEVDKNWEITFINDRFSKMLGYSPEQLIGRQFNDYVCQEYKEKAQEEYTKRGQGQAGRYELELARADGQKIPVFCSPKPFYDTKGNYLGSLGVITEITELKQIEGMLRKNETCLSKINECFLNFVPDSLVNINHLTSLCGKLFGATCAIYNRLDEGILCSWGQWNTPTDYNPVDRPDGHICYDVIKDGADEVFVVSDLQKTHYAQTDPNVIPYKLQTYIGKAVKFSTSCVGSLCVVFQDDYVPNEADKKIIGIISSAIGVEEERRQANASLHERESLLEAFTNALPDIAFILDEDGKYVEIMAAQNHLLYAQAEKMKGRYMHDILPNESADKFHKIIRNTINLDEPQIHEYKLDVPAGETWFQARTSPMGNKIDGKNGVVWIAHDITQHKQSQEALQNSEERFRALAGATFEAVFISEKGICTDTNQVATKMFGYEHDELIGIFGTDVIAPESKELVKHQMLSGSEEPYEAIAQRKDGTTFHAEIRGIMEQYKGKSVRATVVRDIDRIKRTEEALRKSHGKLEMLVKKRTSDLVKINERLKCEIEEHKSTGSALNKRRKEVEKKAKELEELNTALRVLLKQRDKDKIEFEEKIIANTKTLVLPYIEKLYCSRLREHQTVYLNVIKSNLESIIAPFLSQLVSKYSDLTPTEIQVANLVKEGKTTKEIAVILDSSAGAIDFHRNNIRKKLGLCNTKTNLRSFLLTLI